MIITQKEFNHFFNNLHNMSPDKTVMIDNRISFKDLFSIPPNEKLYLHNIRFYLPEVNFYQFDLTGCVFSECDFSFIKITDTNFKNAEFVNTDVPTEIICNKESISLLPENWQTVVTDYINNKNEKIASKLFSNDAKIPIRYIDLPEAVKPTEYYDIERLAPFITQSDIFYEITPHIDIEKDDSGNEAINYFGWKLHLSIAPQDIEKAFDLIGPMLVKQGLHFKVINLHKKPDDNNIDDNFTRIYHGAQITIYLEKNDKPAISEHELLTLINNINDKLKSNHIAVGIAPKSDAKTICDYISIRNDKYSFPERYASADYLSAELAGKNYNLGEHHNPFPNILLTSTQNFDLDEIMMRFEVNNKEGLINSLYLFTSVICRRYTDVTIPTFNISPELQAWEMPSFFEYDNMLDQIYDDYQLEDKDLKPEFQGNEVIKLRLKLILLFRVWIREIQTLSPNSIIPLIDIKQIYPFDDDFSKAFLIINDLFTKLNKLTNNNVCSIPNFSDSIAELTSHKEMEKTNLSNSLRNLSMFNDNNDQVDNFNKNTNKNDYPNTQIKKT